MFLYFDHKQKKSVGYIRCFIPFIFLFSLFAQAEEKDASSTITWESAHQIQPCQTKPDDKLNWSDRTYLRLSNAFCSQARWFDSFFTSSEPDPNGKASSLIRLRMQYEWHDKEGMELKPRLSARFYLPKTEKKLKLIIEGGEEPENQVLRKEPDELKSSERQGGVSAAIRWLALNEKFWDVSFDGGVHLHHARLDPFVRSQVEYERPTTLNSVARVQQTFLVNARDFWTETTEFNIDRLHNNIGYRWYNRLEYGDETHKWEWQTSFIRAQQLNNKTALLGYLSFSGATGDAKDDESENIRLGLNLRRSFYRPWIFYEIEPMLNWPRKYDRHLEPAIQLSFEIAFGKSRRQKQYQPLTEW